MSTELATLGYGLTLAQGQKRMNFNNEYLALCKKYDLTLVPATGHRQMFIEKYSDFDGMNLCSDYVWIIKK